MDIQNLAFLLQACIATKSFKNGRVLHQKILSLGLQDNFSLCKNLMTLYISSRSVESARKVFQTIQSPLDISLWNGLLAAYTKNHLYKEALHFFEELCLFNHLKPDNYTYSSVLRALGGLSSIQYGKKIHSQVIKCGFGSDVVIASSLVGMYAKCNAFNLAIQLFNDMPERDVPCWNMMISCYYQDGQCEKALEVYAKMRSSGLEPDSVTFTVALSACARLFDLDTGKKIHEELMRNGFELDGFVSCAIVDMYGKCGCPEMAREVFARISRKSVVAWNAMIGGYASKCDSKSCIELFTMMYGEGVRPTSTTLSTLLMACSRSMDLKIGKFIHGFIIRCGLQTDVYADSSLIDLYFKCGSVASAEFVFEKLEKKNIVLWNVMISGYVTVGKCFEALEIFEEMRAVGVKPDVVTFTSLLSACSQLAIIDRGREIHNYIVESEFKSNEVVMCALVDMYAKCGAVDDARRIFDSLPIKDSVSWTSMITAYGSHGQVSEALDLFHRMQKTAAKPDRVTFLAVISACSHAGLVDDGCRYFNDMIDRYGIKPRMEQYSCLIDLLGRAGRLEEAFKMLQSTPEIKTNAELLGGLLFACNIHKNLELGEEVSRLLIKMDSSDPSTYIVLSNMYASAGRWDKVRLMRSMIKERGLRKNPGCSWIEVNRRIHSFFVEDKSHPQTDIIYECLESFVHKEDDESLLVGVE